jgi:hypothetical protein
MNDIDDMPQRHAGGRPPFKPSERDAKQVAMLAGMGIPDYDIAKVIGVSPPTLRKYFAAELEVGHIKANAQVAQSLFKQATDAAKPNVAAAIFWLKCRAGWRESDQAEPPGKKEMREHLAKTAEAGTSWDGLLQ